MTSKGTSRKYIAVECFDEVKKKFGELVEGVEGVEATEIADMKQLLTTRGCNLKRLKWLFYSPAGKFPVPSAFLTREARAKGGDERPGVFCQRFAVQDDLPCSSLA